MKNIFYNSAEARLRAGWRIIIFIIIFWLFSALIFVIKPLFGEITKREFLENYAIIIIAILALGATITVPFARKFLDKKSFKSLGLTVTKNSIKDLLFGFFLSGLMAASVFFIMLFFGLIEFNAINFGSNADPQNQVIDFVTFMSTITFGSLAILLLETILVGWWEELVFRGYLLQNMIDGMGLNTAVIISCLIYGLIHITNPNAGLLSSSIIVLFGFLRIYGYLVTKMLWLSIGMHIGWNFFQGPVFGFAASGHKRATIIEQNPLGPDWLSGGEFGPEGSVTIIPIIFLALLIMHWWGRKSSNL